MSQFIRNKNYNEKLSKKKRAYAEKLSVSHVDFPDWKNITHQTYHRPRD